MGTEEEAVEGIKGLLDVSSVTQRNSGGLCFYFCFTFKNCQR